MKNRERRPRRAAAGLIPFFLIFNLSFLILSCSSDSSSNDDICFPRQVDRGGDRAVMEALFTGKLELRGKCLYAVSGEEAILIIWPPKFTLDTTGGTMRVLDGNGKAVAEVGKPISMGGGMGDKLMMSEIDGGKEAVCCDGPYWIVGDMVDPGLAGRHGAEPTMLAIQNKGEVDFDSVRIAVPSTTTGEGKAIQLDLGPLKAGETTQYYELPLLYNYAYIRVLAGGKEHLFQPIDYVGEEPKAPGNYMYGLTLEGEQVKIELIQN